MAFTFTYDDKIALTKHLIQYWENPDYNVPKAERLNFEKAKAKISRRVFERWAYILGPKTEGGRNAMDSKKTLNFLLDNDMKPGVQQMLDFISEHTTAKAAIIQITSVEEVIAEKLRTKYSVWGKIIDAKLDLVDDPTTDQTITSALDEYVELVETVTGIYDWTQNIDTVYHDDSGQYMKNLLKARSLRRRQRILSKLHNEPLDKRRNEPGKQLSNARYDYDYILVSWLRHAFPYVDDDNYEGVKLMNHVSFQDAVALLNDSYFQNELVRNLEVLYKLARYGEIVDETRTAATAALSWRKLASTDATFNPTIVRLMNLIQLSMCSDDVKHVAYPLLSADDGALSFAEHSAVES